MTGVEELVARVDPEMRTQLVALPEAICHDVARAAETRAVEKQGTALQKGERFQ